MRVDRLTLDGPTDDPSRPLSNSSAEASQPVP
jgi:hypothetical protein